jgi:quercetin dioxygenase-like cupin family protein
LPVNEKEYVAQLKREGFAHTYVWEDGPNTRYPDHTHGEETTHIILEGEMRVGMAGKSNTYRVGDRFNVPANSVHCAVMGPRGCKYIVGER